MHMRMPTAAADAACTRTRTCTRVTQCHTEWPASKSGGGVAPWTREAARSIDARGHLPPLTRTRTCTRVTQC